MFGLWFVFYEIGRNGFYFLDCGTYHHGYCFWPSSGGCKARNYKASN